MIGLFSHRRARHRIESMLGGDLSAKQHRHLREHLAACEPCRAYYEQARNLETTLSGDALAGRALERLADWAVAEVAPRPRSVRRPWLVGALSMSAAALLFFMVWPQHTNDDAFTPRGKVATMHSASLQVFAIDKARQKVILLDREGDRVALPPDTLVQLAYRNEQHHFALVLGVDPDGHVEWYHPRESEAELVAGVPLKMAAQSEPFGHAWSLAAGADAVRLYAIFTLAPLTYAQAQRVVAALASPPFDAEEAELPADAEVDSVLIEIAP